MLHAGLDLSRRKVDVCLLCEAGEIVDEWASPPDADGLGGLARRAAMHAPRVRGVIESMNGARFVHDQLEEHGWDVLIADSASPFAYFVRVSQLEHQATALDCDEGGPPRGDAQRVILA